jgi:hypothetical protein
MVGNVAISPDVALRRIQSLIIPALLAPKKQCYAGSDLNPEQTRNACWTYSGRREQCRAAEADPSTHGQSRDAVCFLREAARSSAVEGQR